MVGLPIAKMTLYKHGVAFYQRRGAVEGDAVTLMFRKDEMNDVLKSLTAFTVGRGQVTGMDYETPEDKAALLARSSIHLSDDASLRDLLRDLRGRSVEVTTPAQKLAGLVVGVDLPGEREPLAAAIFSLLLAGQNVITPLRLGDVLSLTLNDGRAAGDLTYVLETSLAAEDKRAVTVRLSESGADLVVSYIAPSPTWRVSYRLVADETPRSEEDAGQTGANRVARGLIQGWGLFDNTFDEDLENVNLSFVAGMPVSFIYDLYTPFTPERPVVGEEERGVAAPVEFETAVYAAAGPAAEQDFMAPPMPSAAPPMARSMALRAADLGEATAVAAAGQAQGEFFSYVVNTPVSVHRGRSAMVPILQAPLAYHKTRIYNGRKHPVNPVITARFKNETGLTLERGPVTVIEDGEYAGEAILPFTAPGNDIYLAYAVDLGVRVSEKQSSERIVNSVNIEKGLLVIQEYDAETVIYEIVNNNDAALPVTVEHPRRQNYTPYDTPDPAETTENAYRYVVTVPAHKTKRFTARQRRLIARHEQIRNQGLEQLRRWLKDRILDDATFAALQGVLALYGRIGEMEGELKANEARRGGIANQQKGIQGNLTGLRDGGEEGKLRARYVRTLSGLEDELAQLAQKDADLRAAIEQTKAEIAKIIEGL